MSLDFEIISNGPNHEELPSVSPEEYLGFVKPGVSCEITNFGQFLYFLISFEWIILDFEEFEDVPASAADEMGLRGAYCDGVSSFYSEVADSESPAPRNV